MTRTRITWGRAAQIWWAFAWRSSLIFALLNTAAWLLVGQAGLAPRSGAHLAGLILSWVLSVGASVWAMRQALENDYVDFRVTVSEPYAQTRLRELEAESGGSETP